MPPAFVLSQDQTLRCTSPGAPKNTRLINGILSSQNARNLSISPALPQLPRQTSKRQNPKARSQTGKTNRSQNTRSTKRSECRSTKPGQAQTARPAARVSLQIGRAHV